jgi:thiamine biosynthesis lipoprotein ApbE
VREATHFECMGCTVEVAGAVGPGVDQIRRLFQARDRRFSRFRPDSELTLVNEHSGRPTPVSGEFAQMLALALEMAAVTDGFVDPTVGAAVREAGYDRDFALLGDDPRPAGVASVTGWRAVRRWEQIVHLPRGCELDLNGVVKSQTVDEAADLLGSPGFVAAGGDIAVRGEVDIALPGDGAVRLLKGGVATSGSGRRRWRRGGTWYHHLIDPSTGASAASPWEQVTVAGATCLDADVAAKAAFLSGVDGPAWLEDRALPGRFVAADGSVLETTRWRAMLEAPACI